MEFVINSTREIFEAWLKTYVDNGWELCETTTGYSITRGIVFPRLSLELTEKLLKIFDQEPTPATASTTAGHQEAITIDLQALAPARVLVATSCTAPELEDYHADLLAEVGRLWPEAAASKKTPKAPKPGGAPLKEKYNRALTMLDAGKSVSAVMVEIGLDPDSKNDRDKLAAAIKLREEKRRNE